MSLSHVDIQSGVPRVFDCGCLWDGFTFTNLCEDNRKLIIEESPILKSVEAKRYPVNVRYDVLFPEFLKALALIGNHGAIKYGDFNWTKSRLKGVNGPVNHMYDHLNKYTNKELYDHEDVGTERKYHLAALAFNAMMEYYYECHPELK